MEQLNLFREWECPESGKLLSRSTVFTCLGSNAVVDSDREQHDFYATEPIAAKLLTDVEKFKPTIWECACGKGHLAKVFLEQGYNVLATDLVDRGFGQGGVDFFQQHPDCTEMDIVTNPPYKIARQFIEHGLNLLPDGGKLAMFLKLTFLESKERRELFDNQPFRTLYVCSSRIQAAKNGDFVKYGNSAMAFGWYVWEKGFRGDPIIKWVN
ncbi:MAG: class I SAM-dependent methyltransferase [Clostridia bacterium]|nr:class I SAM-dependent methyltransferase [Clostridia bacterium]